MSLNYISSPSRPRSSLRMMVGKKEQRREERRETRDRQNGKLRSVQFKRQENPRESLNKEGNLGARKTSSLFRRAIGRCDGLVQTGVVHPFLDGWIIRSCRKYP